MLTKIQKMFCSLCRRNKTELHIIQESDKNSKTVIFIHGFDGHYLDTWKLSGHESLPEMVAQDFEHHSVYSFGYPTSFGFDQKHFSKIARLLYTAISTTLHQGEEIYMVAHSMGGLVAIQMLVDQIDKYNGAFVQRIRGIVYLAVPFEGTIIGLLGSNSQSRALKPFDERVGELREKWVLHLHQNDGKSGKPRYQIAERVIYGLNDKVVTQNSAKPPHLMDGWDVDADHTSICKVTKDSHVYQLIKQFLDKPASKQSDVKNDPLVMWFHGSEKQSYKEAPFLELDWTEHFDVHSNPRRLPSQEVWENKIKANIKWALERWSSTKSSHNGRIRMYSKLCLTGALLIGTRFSRTAGAVVEVDHDNQIWSTQVEASESFTSTSSTPGNSSDSDVAVLVLSVTSNIQNPVEGYVKKIQLAYREIVHVLPRKGTGQQIIETNQEAVSYARSVKRVMCELQSCGIREIHLFISSPLSVAVFVGHFLTAPCSIQTYEFNRSDYTPSCQI